MNEQNNLVEVQNLVKHFPITSGVVLQKTVGQVRAVDGISFNIQRGETLGLVGESGCGKTTVGRTILGLYPATDGEIHIAGLDVRKVRGAELMALRRKSQIIFQDPFASLNPRWTVNAIITEPIRVHRLAQSQKERNERAMDLLEKVGLSTTHFNRFPHEFSGGQRQRIGIARALASEPEFIVCDEPISALDVSIQAQVVNLLENLQDQLGLTYLFIAHDLSMVRHICDRVAVMYLGVFVEMADRDELYENPLHPYTQALLSAVPIPDPKLDRLRKRTVLSGEIPSPSNPPSGCRFHPRCPVAEEICAQEKPAWRQVGASVEIKWQQESGRMTSGAITNEHWVACHLVHPQSGSKT